MSQSLIQQSGAQPQKQPRYVPIHIANATAGLITNRSALHDPSIGIYARFYGGQPDALLAGSNIEISPQQTWKHRPGNSLFVTLPSTCLTTYPFYNANGTITLYMDTSAAVYSYTGSSPTLVWTKSSGAGQTSFVQIGDVLYFANGVDNKKIINGNVYNWAIDGPSTEPTVTVDSIGGGAAASIPWSADTVFTTMGLLKDSNGNMQQLVGINANGTNTSSTVIGTSGVGAPIFSTTSSGTVTETSGLEWECYGPVGSWASSSTYTNASNPGSAAAPAFIYDTGSGNIFGFITGGAGTGTSGGTKPNFGGVPLGGHVTDNGFKWYNYGAPAQWAPSTHYDEWGIQSDLGSWVVSPTTPKLAGYGTSSAQTVYFQAVITAGGGTSDSSHTGPQWATTSTNPVTTDGQLAYQYLGSATRADSTTYTAWQSGTPSFSTIYDGTNFQVCIVGGLSGASAPATWQADYGMITIDGTVQWVNVGAPITWAASTKWFLPASGFAPPVQGVNPYPGSSILDSNGNVEVCVSSGKSGATHPVWPTQLNAQTNDSSTLYWQLTALASTFKGSTALAFQKGYAYCYAWKSRSATDYYVTNAPNGQATALGPPTGSGTGGITTASPVYEMPTGSNAGAIMQVSGLWPTDTQYDTVCVFRCTDGSQGGPYLELTEIGCPAPVNGQYQGGWAFYDSIPDIELNELIEADVVGLNTPPPTGLNYLDFMMNRLWGAVADVVYCSSGPDIPPDNGNGYEGWAPANTFYVQSPVNKTMATQSGLLCLTQSQPYIISGGPAVSQFFPWRIATGFSLANTNALWSLGGEIYLFTADGRFVAWQPGTGHTEPGFPIADQLAGFTPADVYITEHASGQDPSAFYVCNGSTGWFRLVPHASPGFVSSDQPVWSPFATITGGCTGVQSVMTAPGVRSLLVYQSGGIVLKRDLTTAQDNGTSFAGSYTIGSIVLAHPGQLAELGFLTCEFASAGSPTVSYILNEILGTSSSGLNQWQQFTSSLYDPPLYYGLENTPVSYNPLRYEFKQTVNTNQNPLPLLARHLQIQVNYPAANAFHELYSFTIDGALHAEL